MSNIFMPEGEYSKIAIFAPGPSLTEEDTQKVMAAGWFTIAIGDAYLKNPMTDLLYHCDARWWRYYKGVEDFYGCQRVSLEDVPELPKVKQIIRSRLRLGLELVPPYIVTGGNSGYQTINLAVHYKPKEILLLGYDMKKSLNGDYNVRGDHPKAIKGSTKFSVFQQKFTHLVEPLDKLGIKVYNCTRDTDLHCFPKRRLEDVLR